MLKTITFFCFLTFAFLLLNSCGNDSSTNSTGNNPCVKSCTLLKPANDTVISAGSITFYWNAATCNPAWYRIQIAKDSNFTVNVYTSPSISQTSVGYNLSSDSIPYFWRIKAYYTENNNAVIDSFTTSHFKLIAQ